MFLLINIPGENTRAGISLWNASIMILRMFSFPNWYFYCIVLPCIGFWVLTDHLFCRKYFFWQRLRHFWAFSSSFFWPWPWNTANRVHVINHPASKEGKQTGETSRSKKKRTLVTSNWLATINQTTINFFSAFGNRETKRESENEAIVANIGSNLLIWYLFLGKEIVEVIWLFMLR